MTDKFAIGFSNDAFGDDEVLFFGADKDYSVGYDSGDDTLKFTDEKNNVLGFEVERNGSVALGGDLSANDGETIWDESNTYIPQARLQNDSVTVAGNSVSLGASTSIDHADLSTISTDDHHTKYTDSEAISAVEAASFTDLDTGAIVEDGTTHLSFDGTGNVTVSNGNLNLDGNKITDTTGPLTFGGDLNAEDGETIWDESNTYIPQARLQNDSVTVAGNSVSLGGSTAINHADLSTISTDDHHAKYTDSEAVTAIETATLGSNIDFGGNSLINVGGTTDASAGAIRLSNTAAVNARNNGDSADITLIETDTSDNVLLGTNATAVNVQTTLQENGSDVLTTADNVFADVEDSGAAVLSDVTGYNFGTNLSVTDDGDGTVTIDASGGGSGTDKTTAYFHGGLG